MKQLVFVHGRAQEHKDATALKQEWIDSWDIGLRASGLSMPIDATDIHFPYYGDTLFDLASGVSTLDTAAIIVKGRNLDRAQIDPVAREFLREVLLQTQRERGAIAADNSDAMLADFNEKGVLNWGWVQHLLETIDRTVPFASGTSIALATNDVYQYLYNNETRNFIENGVRQAFKPATPAVVVSHSLGTVVAYNMLRREGEQQGWQVPLFVTLGSPLAVSAVRKKLAPNGHPACARRWFNAFDPRDVVALFPLDAANFPVDPEIVNKDDVNNSTSNRHGISGYLSDPDVAREIYSALTE